MRVVLPLIQVLIVALLYLSLRGWAQTLPVVLSLPCAALGSVRLLALLDYNLSTVTWAGLIALEGVADVATAMVEGTAKCLRPVLMTAATPLPGLMSLLWESGVGADLSARPAAPVVGGLGACMFPTLPVLPAVYAIWRHWQLRTGRLSAVALEGTP